jgi:hypothetical protein
VLLESGRITPQHMEAHEKLSSYRHFLKAAPITVQNISSSEEFSNTSLSAIQRKAEYLGLDNIVYVAGDFAHTMSPDYAESSGLRFSCCLLDCDLYMSYVNALAYLWPRLAARGFIFLDEYFSLKFPGARIACDEFFEDKPQKPRRLASDDDFFERWGVEK